MKTTRINLPIAAATSAAALLVASVATAQVSSGEVATPREGTGTTVTAPQTAGDVAAPDINVPEVADAKVGAPSEVATPREGTGSTITAPSTAANAGPANGAGSDAMASGSQLESLDADEVRARTQERMNQDAQAAPAPSPASDVEKPKYSLDADEVRERTAEQMLLFRAGLKASNFWYGHSKSVVWMQTLVPAGFEERMRSLGLSSSSRQLTRRSSRLRFRFCEARTLRVSRAFGSSSRSSSPSLSVSLPRRRPSVTASR